MTEQNNPASTPDNSGQAAGQAKPANANLAAGGNQPEGLKDDVTKIQMDPQEIDALKRDAGRWKKHQDDARKERMNKKSNRSNEDYKLDDATPEALEALRVRDQKLDELSLTNKVLSVKDKVRDLMDDEEYKGVSSAIKKAIVRNPLGFINPASDSLEDCIADIKDYLDEELDNVPINTFKKDDTADNIEIKKDNHQVPPIGGSGPASPNSVPDNNIAGKTGPARSTAILGNLLKNRGNN